MRLSARRKRRFFQVKRGSKVFIPTPKHQIVIPFRKISVALIFLLSLLCVYLAFRSDLFLVHHVEMKTSKESAEEKRALGLIEEQVRGRSIFFINQKALKEKILKNFLSISDVSFKRDFPNGLLVETLPREPVAVVKCVKEASPHVPDSTFVETIQGTASGKVAFESARVATPSASLEDNFLVDKDGLVFAKAASFSGLPLFYLFDEKLPSLGENIGQRRIQMASEIIEALRKDKIEVGEVFLTAFGSIEMILRDGIKVLFSSQKSSIAQVTSLQLILSSAKMEGKVPKVIDLRFEKPILRY